MHTDELTRDGGRWWYTCTCGYEGSASVIRGGQLLRGIHRHLHRVGRSYYERRRLAQDG